MTIKTELSIFFIYTWPEKPTKHEALDLLGTEYEYEISATVATRMAYHHAHFGSHTTVVWVDLTVWNLTRHPNLMWVYNLQPRETCRQAFRDPRSTLLVNLYIWKQPPTSTSRHLEQQEPAQALKSIGTKLGLQPSTVTNPLRNK